MWIFFFLGIFVFPFLFPFSRPVYSRYLLRFIYFLAAVNSWVLIISKTVVSIWLLGRQRVHLVVSQSPQSRRAGFFFCIEITSKTKSLSFSLSVEHVEDETSILLQSTKKVNVLGY